MGWVSSAVATHRLRVQFSGALRHSSSVGADSARRVRQQQWEQQLESDGEANGGRDREEQREEWPRRGGEKRGAEREEKVKKEERM